MGTPNFLARGSNLSRSQLDRSSLAEHRLSRVLRTYTVASMRTLENKISDGGPADMRIDPHVLTDVRNRLLAGGTLQREVRDNTPWYSLAAADPAVVATRLADLLPLHRQYQRLGQRVGQALEIAIYRALCAQTQLTFFGSFRGLDGPDDTLYSKAEPPQTISGKTMEGELDFIAMTSNATLIGIEAKNIREWIYPQREEVTELLKKCTAVDVVPVLIARRIHFSTFRVLNRCGVILHQTYNQLLPTSAAPIAAQARDKNMLGFHDIRLGNQPDARLTKFLHENLPAVVPDARERFEAYVDLLSDYGNGIIAYDEFAARVRRRSQGIDEDFDPP
jgi:hypothetical protein